MRYFPPVNDSVPVTIGGTNKLTISATGLTTGININEGAGLTTIGSNLELGYLSQIVDVNNADGLLISGVISGTNGLTKAGIGLLTLTATETYTGATVVSDGTMQLGDGLTPGASIASSDSVFQRLPMIHAMPTSPGFRIPSDQSPALLPIKMRWAADSTATSIKTEDSPTM